MKSSFFLTLGAVSLFSMQTLWATTKSSPPPTSITHKAARGDTLWKISQAYGVPVSTLQQANKLPGTKIVTGQHLHIPCAVHVVKKGDTLMKLQQRYGSNVAGIRKANALRSDTILIGQKLLVPSPHLPEEVRKAVPPTESPDMEKGSLLLREAREPAGVLDQWRHNSPWLGGLCGEYESLSLDDRIRCQILLAAEGFYEGSIDGELSYALVQAIIAYNEGEEGTGDAYTRILLDDARQHVLQPFSRHTVAPGDTPASVAQAWQTNGLLLGVMNPGRFYEDEALEAGTVLLVPNVKGGL